MISTSHEDVEVGVAFAVSKDGEYVRTARGKIRTWNGKGAATSHAIKIAGVLEVLNLYKSAPILKQAVTKDEVGQWLELFKNLITSDVAKVVKFKSDNYSRANIVRFVPLGEHKQIVEGDQDEVFKIEMILKADVKKLRDSFNETCEEQQ